LWIQAESSRWPPTWLSSSGGHRHPPSLPGVPLFVAGVITAFAAFGILQSIAVLRGFEAVIAALWGVIVAAFDSRSSWRDICRRSRHRPLHAAV